MSTISATDIIAGTTAIKPPDAEPNAPDRCYVEVIVSGEYIQHWDSGVMNRISFSPQNDGDVTDVYYNGHSHTGTLTTWQLWDDGNEWVIRNDNGFYHQKVYINATAKYSGYLECS